MITLNETDCNCGCGKRLDLNFYGRINLFRGGFDNPMKINRGASCPAHNTKVGGRAGSSHLEGRAVDVARTPELLAFCTEDNLTKYRLYMEHPDSTPGWIHLTDRAPPSGKRIFKP